MKNDVFRDIRIKILLKPGDKYLRLRKIENINAYFVVNFSNIRLIFLF